MLLTSAAAIKQIACDGEIVRSVLSPDGTRHAGAGGMEILDSGGAPVLLSTLTRADASVALLAVCTGAILNLAKAGEHTVGTSTVTPQPVGQRTEETQHARLGQ